MNWCELEPWFAEESLRLHCLAPGLAEAVRAGPRPLIEWGLQMEWDFEEALAQSCLVRAETGEWPAEMPEAVRFLLSHRLMAAGCHVELLSALGCPLPGSRETALMLLCVKHWNLLRYVSWLVFAGRQSSGPVHDPFDPPAWAG